MSQFILLVLLYSVFFRVLPLHFEEMNAHIIYRHNYKYLPYSISLSVDVINVS